MPSRLRYWSEMLMARLPALIPSSCALCAMKASGALCTPCRAQFFQPRAQRCHRCALPTDSAPACGDCLSNPPAFDATIVATDYLPPIDQLVLGLKFGGRLALAPLFGALLRDALLATRHAAATLPTCLAPVPLSAQRLAERGFNQALEIARPLSRSLGIELIPQLLVRVRETRAQAELPVAERHKNVRHAFVVAQSSAELAGRHVGIVDDVITTGATLNELAATLKRFGAARVTNLVFAQTLPK